MQGGLQYRKEPIGSSGEKALNKELAGRVSFYSEDGGKGTLVSNHYTTRRNTQKHELQSTVHMNICHV
jgi:hypothetical protein